MTSSIQTLRGHEVLIGGDMTPGERSVEVSIFGQAFSRKDGYPLIVKRHHNGQVFVSDSGHNGWTFAPAPGELDRCGITLIEAA